MRRKPFATAPAHPNGRRRLACYHEAGHLLARWYFGFAADYAVVLSVEQIRAGILIEDRRGRGIRAEGLVTGYDIDFPLGPLPDAAGPYNENGPRRAEIALIDAMAGIAAEAVYRKQSFLVCWLGGGQRDREQAEKIASLWLDDPESAIGIAWTRAAAIVRSGKGQRAIRATAEVLLERGRIEACEFDAICSAYYGAKPCHDAWSTCWPPSLARLRAGAVPPSKFTTAHACDEGSVTSELLVACKGQSQTCSIAN